MWAGGCSEVSSEGRDAEARVLALALRFLRSGLSIALCEKMVSANAAQSARMNAKGALKAQGKPALVHRSLARRFAVCGLRFAVCGLRFAVCGLQMLDAYGCHDNSLQIWFLLTLISYTAVLPASACRLCPNDDVCQHRSP